MARIDSPAMASLDRFIAVMFEKKASAVALENDKPVALDIQGTRRAITKEPVPTPKLIALIKEIMPVGMHDQFDRDDGRLAFGYILDGKKVDVETTRSGGAVTATLGPAKARRSTAAVSIPAEALTMNAPPPAAAAPPTGRKSQSVKVEGTSKWEERLQGL